MAFTANDRTDMMTELSKADVHRLAQQAGFDMNDERAETIASRLTGVLQELEAIPAESLDQVEPHPRFVVEEGGQHEQR